MAVCVWDTMCCGGVDGLTILESLTSAERRSYTFEPGGSNSMNILFHNTTSVSREFVGIGGGEFVFLMMTLCTLLTVAVFLSDGPINFGEDDELYTYHPVVGFSTAIPDTFENVLLDELRTDMSNQTDEASTSLTEIQIQQSRHINTTRTVRFNDHVTLIHPDTLVEDSLSNSQTEEHDGSHGPELQTSFTSRTTTKQSNNRPRLKTWTNNLVNRFSGRCTVSAIFETVPDHLFATILTVFRSDWPNYFDDSVQAPMCMFELRRRPLRKVCVRALLPSVGYTIQIDITPAGRTPTGSRQSRVKIRPADRQFVHERVNMDLDLLSAAEKRRCQERLVRSIDQML